MEDLQLGRWYVVADMPEDRLDLSTALLGSGRTTVDITIEFRDARAAGIMQRTFTTRLIAIAHDRSANKIDLYGEIIDDSYPFEVNYWVHIRIISGVPSLYFQDHPPRVEF